MEKHTKFVDLLAERRKDCDIFWVSRPMDPLPPHKLPPGEKYNRKQIKNFVLQDDRVQSGIAFLAKVKGLDANVVKKDAEGMINEMASKAHLTTVRGLGFIITKALKRIFASIYINQDMLFNLKKEMQISQVQYVYAPTHRSYLDFVILSYILFSYDMALPNIASGMDFYQMSIIGELLRHTGAFYIRRSFATDLLYKNVFRAYVNSIVSHSDRAIEFFIEGTRSRSMKSITPKYGLLTTILESFLNGEVPDIHIIPISISYDRPLEELLFAYEMLGVPKPKESTMGLLKSLSILAKPSAYSNVFFNIGEHISARDYLSIAQRKAKILSPNTKLSPSYVKELAYYIIDAHKKNTVLTPFNIIALLLNQNIQMNCNGPYTLEMLMQEYLWCKNILSSMTEATIYSLCDMKNQTLDEVKSEIMKSLTSHEDLVTLDTTNVLRLRQRHEELKDQKPVKVKGHKLSIETMRIAVSAINLSIYVNPTLAFLVKPAIGVVAIGTQGIMQDDAFERYRFLRTLLSVEFAMQLPTNTSELQSEWDETINILIKEHCILIQDTKYIPGQNEQLSHLLNNLILPFIDATYMSCQALFQWNEATSGDVTNQGFLVESQRMAEEAFKQGDAWGQHPYTLSLDLYNSTWSDFLTQGIIVPNEGKSAYRADKVALALLLTKLKNLSLRRPPKSYKDLTLLTSLAPSTNVQAKL